MPLNPNALKAKSQLSPAAQDRIDKLLDKGESTVHHSNLNTILTSKDWIELADRTFKLSSVFEISTIDNLNKLLTTPRFWQLADTSGFIKSLFRTHYFDILKLEGQAGKIVSQYDNTYKKVKEQNEERRTGSKKTGWILIPPLHPVPASDPNCFSPEYYSDTKGIVTSDEHKAKIEESDKAVMYAKLLKNSYNIILHGAPGTGKTHLAKKIANALEATDDRMKMVQFHPSYDYTDFMEGLRPVNKAGNIGFERKDGTFKKFCKTALRNDTSDKIESEESENKLIWNNEAHSPKYVFIIDEINRGEIAKILGECMFSIDPGYRGNGHTIETQYQNLITDSEDPFKNGFFRPNNVFIIGTMNDIDRGVESMDLALRRRFVFIEIKAEDTQREILKHLSEEDRNTAKNAMDQLNSVIRDKEGLGEDYCIGASYFLKIKDYVDYEDKWSLLWDYHLNSLLKEYLRGREDTESSLDELKTIYDNVVRANGKQAKEDEAIYIDDEKEEA